LTFRIDDIDLFEEEIGFWLEQPIESAARQPWFHLLCTRRGVKGELELPKDFPEEILSLLSCLPPYPRYHAPNWADL
jgi:hypothetical protein